MKPQCEHKSAVQKVVLHEIGAILEVCLACGHSRYVVGGGIAHTPWEVPAGPSKIPPGHRIPLFRVTMSPDTPQAVTTVLRSGYIGEGPKVKEFEQKLRGLTGLDNVYATNSCTSAIELALDVIGIGPGDRVISTPMTCLATNAPLVRRGAQIIWADVNPATGVICPVSVRAILKHFSAVKAIIAVDYAGRLAPILELKQSATRLLRDCRPELSGRIPIIEDAAHVFSTHLGGGDFICLSFQAIKFLTTGDGGALLTQYPCDKAALLRWYGLDRDESSSFRCERKPTLAGGKLHMNDIAAAIGLANWTSAVEGVRLARERALWYSRSLKEVERVLSVPQPVESPWLYPILVQDRAAFIKHMERNGVMVGRAHCRHDDAPVHKKALSPVPLPGVDYFDKHQVCLPCGSWVDGDDARRIEQLVNRQAW